MGISTHVLDTARGRPAAGVAVVLERRDPAGGGWSQVASATTDDDGRVASLGNPDGDPAGTYRIEFDTGGYHRARGERAFHPSVTVAFDVDSGDDHYHVPLLLTAWSYTTYRGS